MLTGERVILLERLGGGVCMVWRLFSNWQLLSLEALFIFLSLSVLFWSVGGNELLFIIALQLMLPMGLVGLGWLGCTGLGWKKMKRSPTKMNEWVGQGSWTCSDLT
ncbi:MAG: hypothetical protein J3R72DRAFT_435611 [Linnemannia gamsii]|nr:MAG: hypothetical protein J3R72DRAFT_435611 [Linnemannia gamsii]